MKTVEPWRAKPKTYHQAPTHWLKFYEEAVIESESDANANTNASANANANINGIHTKNNMSPEPEVGDINI